MQKPNLIISATLVVGAVLGIGAATAADLPARTYTKAPTMVAAVYDWSGFYIGANGGWGSSRKCWDINANNPGVGPFIGQAEGCHDATGGAAGGQVGYRWQSSAWVFGVEAQGDWANLRGSSISALNPGAIDQTKVSAFGLFTGQVGYAWNNTLFYLKGGAAVTSDRYDHFFTAGNVFVNGGNENRWGGVIGVGLEYGFTPNWSAAVEYDHMFMGDRIVDFRSALGTITDQDRIRQNVDLITVRLNYRFGGGGPVVARY